MGGVDKPALVVAGRALLDIALDACAAARTTVVVGPSRPVGRPVAWAREEPAGSGPLAALDAGLRRLPADGGTVTVLAADLPAVTPAAVGTLVATLEAADERVEGVVAADSSGRLQPLLAAYRRPALERAVEAVGDPRNRPMKDLVRRLAVVTYDDAASAADIDTPDDLVRWQKGRL